MGKFVVKETEKSVHFNLVASNGEVIGSSQNYSTKDGCLNGIESVRKIILSSEGYKAKASCKNGVESVRKNAPEARVEEAE